MAGLFLLLVGVLGLTLARSPWAGLVIVGGALLLIDALMVLRHVPAVMTTIESSISDPDPELMAAISEARLTAATAKAIVDESAALIASGDEVGAAAAVERAQVALTEGKIAAGRAARLVARERARLEARVRARIGLE